MQNVSKSLEKNYLVANSKMVKRVGNTIYAHKLPMEIAKVLTDLGYTVRIVSKPMWYTMTIGAAIKNLTNDSQ